MKYVPCTNCGYFKGRIVTNVYSMQHIGSRLVSRVQERVALCKFCKDEVKKLILALRQSSKGISSLDMFDTVKARFNAYPQIYNYMMKEAEIT